MSLPSSSLSIPSFSSFSPLQKHLTRDTSYTPTYAQAPPDPLSFHTLLTLAHRRREFHRHLSLNTFEGTLDYQQIRTLSVDFGIPLRRFSTNNNEIETDCISFFSLMLSSLETLESQRNFAAAEQRLFYCRLKHSGISAAQINDYFWPDADLKLLILSDSRISADCELFFLPMEIAFSVIDPIELHIQNGTAHLSLDNVYRLVSRTFGAKILANMAKYVRSETVVKSLADELRRLARPNPVLTLATLEEQSAKSFPPCMRRIVSSLKNQKYLSYKARFELSLFLKTLGLDYFEQYKFWKKKVWTPQNQWHFESQIVVGLKQIYGLDEAEDDYSPHKCISIINHDCPGKKENVQGCPFVVMGKPELKVFLKALRRGVKHADIETLMKFVPEEPQRACVEFFNGKFIEIPFGERKFERPVDFFYESERRLGK
jgi:DNA primase large subunit